VLATVAVTGTLLVVSVVADRPSTTPPFPESEARAYLDRAIALGLARDYTALCALNGSTYNCERTLDAGRRETVPAQRPTSVSAFYVPKGNGHDTGGWVLTVRGRDGTGKAYRTQVMVFEDDRALTAINIVWWSNARLLLGDIGRQREDETQPG
jgi:hypothetical protein